MFRSVDDFRSAWAQESANTLRLLQSLTDPSLSTQIDSEGRTLGRLAWHLVVTLGEMLPTAGLPMDFHADPAQSPTASHDICTTYEEGARILGEAVATHWNDSQLAETVPMYGMTWARGFVLQCLIVHQAHHRGQMTILMRQAGLPVPGMVGPSREEWAAMGMPAPA